MSKQMRVSDAVYDEIKRLIKEYDVDRRSVLNTSMVLMKCIIENNAEYIEFIDKNNKRVSIPVPILFKEKRQNK